MEHLKRKLTCLFSLLLIVAPGSYALTLNAPMAISQIVTVQPIIVSDDDGSNTATFFGDASQKSIIEGFVDQIWAQAGIDVNFLTANTWNNTFANEGTTNNPRPTSDLNTIVDTAPDNVKNADANVINIFFVNIAAGFSLLNENTAAGLAFRPGNGITQYVGENLLDFTGGQEVIASVVAHEIGHNLGLAHTNSVVDGNLEFPENLMTSNGSGERLRADQIATALNSNLSVTAVPIPAAFWLLASGLVFLFRNKKVVQ
ncbi:MAG: zinc-dependent metalloprotease family protein [Gammaproteobacteria bacterium]